MQEQQRAQAATTTELCSLLPEGFAWATGIEDTFVAQTERVGERVLDEYALTHHYIYWREDIDRAAALGVRAMRYGIPWYKVEPAPGRFNWDWTDRVLEYAAGKGIALIADLMHYGTPLWLDNQFLNSSYPQRVAAYSATFARRYHHLLRHYTPLNEPRITLDFCGERGIWPPYLRGHDGAVKILRSIVRGMALQIEAIRQEDPRAVIVQAEAAGEYLAASLAAEDEAAFHTARTFIPLDLLTGGVGAGHPLFAWLLTNGMSDADLAWHQAHAATVDLVGVNYYPESSVSLVHEWNGAFVPGRVRVGADGLQRALRAFAQRYEKPVLITETSTNGTIEERLTWLHESTAAVSTIRGAGIPLVGYTYWPLFDLIDWSYRAGARPIEEFMARLGPPLLDVQEIAKMLTTMRWNQLEQLPLEAYLAPMGLYELRMGFDGTFERVHTPLVDLYQEVVARGPSFVGRVGEPPLAAST